MNSQNQAISGFNCFLFILNIMVGTGIFLNTSQLYFLLKNFSYLSYIVTGFLMVPIIWLTYLISCENEGCNLSQLFSKYLGVRYQILVSLYSLSKLATSVIGILLISSLLTNFFFGDSTNLLYQIIIFFIIYSISSLMVYREIAVNLIVQKCIIFIKLIPIIAIILFFIFYFFYNNFCLSEICFTNISKLSLLKVAQGASITIFAFSGFESLFAISHMLGADKKRASFILAGSFFTALFLYVLYQFSIGYLASFFLIDNLQVLSLSIFLSNCFSKIYYASFLLLLLNIAILVSSFGVAHGVMYIVVKNIAANLMPIFKNEYNIKYFVFFLVPFYALIGLKNIFVLQQLSSLGTIITYSLFILFYFKSNSFNFILFFSSIISILILFFIHVYNAYNYFGFYGYVIYFILFLLLFLMNRGISR